MTTPDQWSRGDTIQRPNPRVDRLAKLYREKEALEANPAANRSDWLRLAGLFDMANAPISADRCRAKAAEF